MCVSKCVIFSCPFTPLPISLLLPHPADFSFNPRQYVNNTDTLIPCQDSLPFTLAGLLPSPLLSPSSPRLPPHPPSTHPSPLSFPWLFPDRPTANVHQMPPRLHPIPQPVTAHSSVRYRQMELLSVLAVSGLRLPHSTPSILSSSFLSLTK